MTSPQVIISLWYAKEIHLSTNISWLPIRIQRNVQNGNGERVMVMIIILRGENKNAMLFELGSGSLFYFSISLSAIEPISNGFGTMPHEYHTFPRHHFSIDRRKIKTRKKERNKVSEVPSGDSIQNEFEICYLTNGFNSSHSLSIGLGHERLKLNDGSAHLCSGVMDDRVTCRCVLLRKSRAATEIKLGGHIKCR